MFQYLGFILELKGIREHDDSWWQRRLGGGGIEQKIKRTYGHDNSVAIAGGRE